VASVKVVFAGEPGGGVVAGRSGDAQDDGHYEDSYEDSSQ